MTNSTTTVATGQAGETTPTVEEACSALAAMFEKLLTREAVAKAALRELLDATVVVNHEGDDSPDARRRLDAAIGAAVAVLEEGAE